MAREFKPVRFFVMMALTAFVVCGVTSFYTHRAHAALPSMSLISSASFKQQGSGNQLRSSSRAAELQAWDLGFENGYTDGFNKAHPGR